MNSSFSVLIALNNYIQDVAIVTLAASGAVVWIVLRKQGNTAPAASPPPVVRIHHILSRVAIFSLALISGCAIPRILFFRSLEFAPAVEDHFIEGLTARHLLSLVIALTGVWLWVRANRRMKQPPAAVIGEASPGGDR